MTPEEQAQADFIARMNPKGTKLAPPAKPLEVAPQAPAKSNVILDALRRREDIAGTR